jgi:hypothetical protein
MLSRSRVIQSSWFLSRVVPLLAYLLPMKRKRIIPAIMRGGMHNKLNRKQKMPVLILRQKQNQMARMVTGNSNRISSSSGTTEKIYGMAQLSIYFK